MKMNIQVPSRKSIKRARALLCRIKPFDVWVEETKPDSAKIAIAGRVVSEIKKIASIKLPRRKK
jgi:hypothetical protein